MCVRRLVWRGITINYQKKLHESMPCCMQEVAPAIFLAAHYTKVNCLVTLKNSPYQIRNFNEIFFILVLSWSWLNLLLHWIGTKFVREYFWLPFKSCSWFDNINHSSSSNHAKCIRVFFHYFSYFNWICQNALPQKGKTHAHTSTTFKVSKNVKVTGIA